MSLKGLVLELNQQKVFVPKVVGDFNAHNLLMVYAVACQLGLDNEKILRDLAHLHPIAESSILQKKKNARGELVLIIIM